MDEYENNLFLSYRHLDNEDGWVSELATFLRVRLQQLLGTSDARVWRDPRLSGGDALWDSIEGALKSCAVFLYVLTPGYLNSENCLREFRFFRGIASSSGGLLIDSKSRLIVVRKTPVEAHVEASRLSGLVETVEFRFYKDDPDHPGAFRELPHVKGRDGHEAFMQQAEDLAQSVHGLLQRIQRAREKVRAASMPQQRRRVCLAQPTSDRNADRDFVAADLLDVVDVVTTPLPPARAAYKPDLVGCVLSLHILGNHYGSSPEDDARSWPALQLEAAAGVRRLVWMPDDLEISDERQRAFVKSLEESDEVGIELVSGGRQEFLSQVKDVLGQLAKPRAPAATGRAVYLVYHQTDLLQPGLRQLKNCFREHGVLVEQPVYEGDTQELQEAEEESLKDSDATLIYFGLARDAWVLARRRQILKTLCSLQLVPKHQRALFLATPSTDQKQGVYMNLPCNELEERGGPPLLIVGNCADIDSEQLRPFVSRVWGDGV